MGYIKGHCLLALSRTTYMYMQNPAIEGVYRHPLNIIMQSCEPRYATDGDKLRCWTTAASGQYFYKINDSGDSTDSTIINLVMDAKIKKIKLLTKYFNRNLK